MHGHALLHFHGIPDDHDRGRFVAAVTDCARSGAFHTFPRQMDAYPQGVSVLLACGHRLIVPTSPIRLWRQANGLWAEQTMPLDPPGEDRTGDGCGLRRLVVPS